MTKIAGSGSRIRIH
jgi:hypothetical protein